MMNLDDIFPLLSQFEHPSLFKEAEHPWDPLKKLGPFLQTLLQDISSSNKSADSWPGLKLFSKANGEAGFIVEEWMELKESLFFPEQGIFLGAGTRLEPTAIIKGPCILGKSNDVRQGAYLRGHVLTGNHCTLGHATEIKNSVLMNHTEAGHFNYVGDSILGSHVNLGAGSKLANLQFRTPEEKTGGFIHPLSIPTGSGDLPTGMEKLGSLVGDHSEIGCNAVLSPGTVLGTQVWVYPNLTIPKGFYPPRQVLAPGELRPRQRPR